MRLRLGVVDIPYTTAEGQTTGEVAEILERKYHVMETFYGLHAVEVADAAAESVQGALETLMMGGPISNNPFGSAEGQIKKLFTRFLEDKEMDRLGAPGVPTRASLRGVSHRFKRKRGPARPSFIDTGLYEANFKAWFET